MKEPGEGGNIYGVIYLFLVLWSSNQDKMRTGEDVKGV